MDTYSVHYKFSQRFDFSAEAAFAWSADYDEGDMARLGRNGTRKIEKINNDTLILTDTAFTGRKTDVKKRMIRIYPELLMLVNTRISAADRYSQFIYQFVPEGENRSRLDFFGAHVLYDKKPSQSKVADLARRMAEDDAAIWKRLAVEMKKDLS